MTTRRLLVMPREGSYPLSMPTASHDSAAPATALSLKERYLDVRQRIDAAARRSGRTGDNIILVAVTKHAAMDDIRKLLDLGHVDLGENRVQQYIQRSAQIDEFLERKRELAGRDAGVPDQVRWHMIGHLQRNKVRRVVGNVRLIHSVDSLRLAEEIQQVSCKQEHPQEVLVQVNVAGEKQKSGVAPAAARHLVDQVSTMVNIVVRGIMVMAPLTDDTSALRPVFDRSRELYEDIRRYGDAENFDILSMGMSTDYEVAIECGANLVRIGTAIFGPGDGTTEED